MANFNLDKRVQTLHLVDLTDIQKAKVDELLKVADVDGDWDLFIAKPEIAAFAQAKKEAMAWAYKLGNWSLVDGAAELEDDTPLVKAVLSSYAAITTFKDLSLGFGITELVNLVTPLMGGATQAEIATRAKRLQQNLYRSDLNKATPTAVITKLIEDKAFKIKDDVNTELLKFFKDNPDYTLEDVDGDDIDPTVAPYNVIKDDLRTQVIVELRELEFLENIAGTVERLLALYNPSCFLHIRFKTLSGLLDQIQKDELKASIGQQGPDMNAVIASFIAGLDPALASRIKWANHLADLSKIVVGDTGKAIDDTGVVTAILDTEIENARQLALGKGLAEVGLLVLASGQVSTEGGDGSLELGGLPPAVRTQANEIRERLFDAASSAVIVRMARDLEVSLPADEQPTVVSLLTSKLVAEDDFTLKNLLFVSDGDSVFAGLTDNVPSIAKEVRKLALLDRISENPATVVALYSANLTDASSITELSKEQFSDRFAFRIGKENAEAAYDSATTVSMETRASDPVISTRINTMGTTLEAIGGDEAAIAKVKEELAKAGGDWQTARDNVGFSNAVIERLDFAANLAEWSSDRTSVVSSIVVEQAAGQPKFNSLSDLARNLKTEEIAARLSDADVDPVTETEAAPAAAIAVAAAVVLSDGKLLLASQLREKLYEADSLAVAEKVVTDGEFAIEDVAVRNDVVRFISNLETINKDATPRSFNLRTDSVHKAFGIEDAFEGVNNPDAVRAEFSAIATLSNGGGIEANRLRKYGLSTAFAISEVPQGVFVQRFKDELGGEAVAQRIHAHAVNTRIRNEHKLVNMRDVARGTGFGMIDGDESRTDRIIRIAELISREASERGLDPRLLNLSTLFGNVDTCECGHCNSVYSPSAYYVDLLNFLRNNNFDGNFRRTGFEGTPLKNLFRRRPDLGHLKLTCENTLTVLPYIDLANEVMESFVHHLEQYENSHADPKKRQASIKVFDVEDETTGELLAQPQNIDFHAYRTLSQAVYPCDLPYHQPIDSIRITLEALKTSRHELIEKFPRPASSCFPGSDGKYEEFHKSRLLRGYTTEFLGMVEEDFKILTKEAFWKKGFYELKDGRNYTDDEYRVLIAVKPTHTCFGFETENEMLLRLPEVKEHLLRRTGVTYVELVELLKTQFLNPRWPQGKSLKILLSLPASYRYLRSLVDDDIEDPEEKFKRLIEYLIATMPGLSCGGPALAELKTWIYCNFLGIGELVVLNSVNLFPAGRIYDGNDELVAELGVDGIIRRNFVPVGSVLLNGNVIDLEGRPFTTDQLKVVNWSGKHIGWITEDGLFVIVEGENDPQPWKWTPFDACDIDNVRLERFDGLEPVPVEFYDRLHRFVRLWRKLGWTVDETDKSILSANSEANSDHCDYPGMDDVKPPAGKLDCPNPIEPVEITPEVLFELVAIKKVVARTGLELLKQLTFWSEISTSGEKSLYVRLFLTHNLAAIDDVFKADANGVYLPEPAVISEHVPILMAALRLKEVDIIAIDRYQDLKDTLTLQSVSSLYRISLLARLIGARPEELEWVRSVFGCPFKSPARTLVFLELWERMEDAGLSFRQLRYIVQGFDDLLKPVGISDVDILRFKKSIYDGLNRIDAEHADLEEDPDPTRFSLSIVRSKSALLFEQSLVDGIVAMIEGTTQYSANTDSGFHIEIPDRLPSAKTLRQKLRYIDADGEAVLEVVGILTEQETDDALTLVPGKKEWKDAINRIRLQAIQYFDTNIADAFGLDRLLANGQKQGIALEADACENNHLHCLLAGDEGELSIATKSVAFLTNLLPLLRKRLGHELIVAAVAELIGIPAPEAECLISEIIVDDDEGGRFAVDTIKAMRTQPIDGDWKGHLFPSQAAEYRFFDRGAKKPVSIWLIRPNGKREEVEFKHQESDLRLQQQDPDRVWYTDPVSLTSELHHLNVPGRSAETLQWKTGTSTRARIPASSLLPVAKPNEIKVLRKLDRSGQLVAAFKLSSAAIRFWQDYKTEGGDDLYDFNDITFSLWQRIDSYADLRTDRPFTLIDLFLWADNPAEFPSNAFDFMTAAADPKEELASRISAATGWNKGHIDLLLHESQFDLRDPIHFRNEENLHRLHDALVLMNRIGTESSRLFNWADPSSNFEKSLEVAADARSVFRAKFDQEGWEQAVKPLNDKLRKNQQNALVAYLLVQDAVVEWGVTDANTLFEFFLIDVQMDTCMKTSRLKQAISSVQLFIHRILIGLEKRYGLMPGAVDRKRWEWMQKYRVWEANRKVFLYPENWIRPELRDDKSQFFKEFESECLQQDLAPDSYAGNLRAYVERTAEVASLKPVGLYAENPRLVGDTTQFTNLHIVARTWTEPFRYYIRAFNGQTRCWNAWNEANIDIATHEYDGSREAFVVPFMWRENLYVLAPAIEEVPEKTLLSVWSNYYKFKTPTPYESRWETPSDREKAEFPGEKDNQSSRLKFGLRLYRQVGDDWISDDSPLIFYDANPEFVVQDVTRREWSDFQNLEGSQPPKDGEKGKIGWHKKVQWNVIKQVSPYSFTVSDSGGRLTIAIYHQQQLVRSMGFDGNSFYPWGVSTSVPRNTAFHYAGSLMYSRQSVLRNANAPVATTGQSYNSVIGLTHETNDRQKLSNSLAQQVLSVSRKEELSEIFDFYNVNLGSDAAAEAFGKLPGEDFHELKLPNAIYNWETAFHAPMLASDLFLKTQQFDEALNAIHAVFDPMTTSTQPNAFWRFRPFRETTAFGTIRKDLLELEPGQPNAEIRNWRDNPFQPHQIARDRGPQVYMKWTVMKYIEALIAIGDYYFRQNTLETLPIAIQYYITASNIFGPAGQHVPQRGSIRPRSYLDLLDKWDAFSNAIVNLELAFPNARLGTVRQEARVESDVDNGDVQQSNVLGFASTLYFCIPDNPKVKELRELIDDRLFKIRHCQDINGVFRELPLFEPPIDPALLVQAAAQGLSLSSVLNDLNSPMPNFRFTYLMQKALELCSEVKTLGAAFLSAKEKKDAESLTALRSSHDAAIQELILSVRNEQLEEAKRSLAALKESRKGPEYRLRHYLELIGEDSNALPDFESDFKELQNLIDSPVDDSGLKLSQFEKQELDKAKDASDRQKKIGSIEHRAAEIHALPTIAANIQFWGLGVTISTGHIANRLQAIARAKRIDADEVSYQSSRFSRLGGFQRQIQDRIQQANAAGYEIKNIDNQILAADIRVKIAEKEIENQKKQIANAKEVDEYLRTKYTATQLYSYMEGELRNLHYSAYKLAYELARKVEKVFRFERGLSTTNFIEPGYWSPGRDGFFAGEKLHQALKRLELVYHEERGHDFEVTKDVSVRQLNPFALAALRENGQCEIELPESLFDMDFPGQYKRRIKSVAISIPAVVGPHTSLNCTLRLIEHKFRYKPNASSASDYPQKIDEDDDRFATTSVPIKAIAASKAQQDSGVFELNFRDERYMPFEGSGAISKWRIQLPGKIRQFNYNTITDVILHVRYTSVDGGDTLKQHVEEYLEDYLAKAEQLERDHGLFALFDLKHDFSSAWNRFAKGDANGGKRELHLGNIFDRLPHLASRNDIEDVSAQDVFFVSSGNILDGLNVKLIGQNEHVLGNSQVGGVPCQTTTDGPVKFQDWKLQADRKTEDIEQIWMIVRLNVDK